MKHFDDPFLSIFDYFNSMKFRAFVTRMSLNLSALARYFSREETFVDRMDLNVPDFSQNFLSRHIFHLHQKELKLSEGNEP